MSRSRILITGGSSYLGQHLAPLAVASDAFDVCYTFYQNDPLKMVAGRPLNIRDETAVHQLVLQFQPDIIIHLVGSNRGADMDAVIRQGTTHITEAAAMVNARLIHLSTDVVFNGCDPPYDETATPTPLNEYGRAKAVAETIVRAYENHVIVRTSLIYGLHLIDHGTAWIVKALQAGQPVKLFDNQRRNPIWAQTLRCACLELAVNDYTGILHVAGKQALSRAEFALKMLDWWGITQRDTLTVGPATGDDWPLDCELDLSRVTAVLSTPLPGVDEVLTQAQNEQ